MQCTTGRVERRPWYKKSAHLRSVIGARSRCACRKHFRASSVAPSPRIMEGLVGRSPPPVPKHPLWRFQSTTFLVNAASGMDPGTYLRSTQTCIERLSRRCKVVRLKPSSSLKVHVTPRAGGPFLLKIKLYTIDCARPTWAVEFHKRRGCAIAFYHIFNAFLRSSLKSGC